MEFYANTTDYACVQDIEYIVKNSAKWREKISILSNVSGSIPPGELTALVSTDLPSLWT